MSTPPKPFVTPEQYLEIERAAEFKSEYYKGEMFAMAGGTLNLRLQVRSDGLYTYPDLVIFCGKPRFADGKRDTITDATVIIEVLSPSTENYDRGFKFEQYRRLESLSDYVVIAQDRVHVEHSTRQGEAWVLRETSDLDAVIELRSIECSFRVREAYSRVEFD